MPADPPAPSVAGSSAHPGEPVSSPRLADTLPPAADVAGLPAEFTAATAALREAFGAGTEAEADEAAARVENLLAAMSPAEQAQASVHLQEQAALAMGDRTAHRLRAALASAELVATRALPRKMQVNVYRVAESGEEFAVLVPTGNTPARRAHRTAMTAGQCPACAALLGADLRVTHKPSCVAVEFNHNPGPRA